MKELSVLILCEGGYSKSCGCEGKKISIIKKSTHSLTKSPEYRAWCDMKQRCHNANNHAYKYYGGRGIIVCGRWLNSFENFLEDMGKRPFDKLTLERIDNDGNYEPYNCCWATRQEQNKNKRYNK